MSISEEEAEERSANDIMNDRAKGFDIQKETLIRFIYSKMPGSCSKVTYVIHHIIIDGWSDNIINEKIMEYYGMLVKGIPYERALAQIKKERRYEGDYKNYINWIQEKKVENALRYWKELLEDFDGACEIKPLLGAPVTGKSNSLIARGMPDEAAKRLINLSRETDFTLNAFFRAAVGILLHIYTGTHDTVFDNVVSGRNADIPGISNMVGLFLNTILVRVQAHEGMTVRELVEQQQLQSVESTNYDFCSLAEIQKNAASLSSEKKLLYVYENYSSGREENPADTPSENSSMEMGLDSSEEQTNYDINLIFSSGHGVGIKVMYSGSRYTEYEMGLLADRLVNILCKITENLDAKAADITCDNDEQLKKQLALFNDTYTDYPRDKTVVELFEEQAEKTPDKTVLVFEGQTLTYRELNLRANAVAYKLRELGVQPDDFVAIVADKSCEMIAGINGILKAGGAYVPIDPTYPEDRVAFMIEDCTPKAILKFTKENVSLPDNIPIVGLGEITVSERDYINPEKVNKPTDAVYCIYTSGTTGKPKGVVVEHRNVVKLVMNCDYTELNDKTVILQTGQLMFDASTFEIWGTELNGGTLHFVNKDIMLNAASFKKYMVDNGVNTLFITTALFNQFINEDNTIFDCLEHLMFGGEATSERQVKILRNRNKKLDFRNVYGPTETTTFASHYIIDKVLEKTPIGKPISNTQMYIMNGSKLCGVGIPGELCITGDGVARGYLNRPELTEQKFAANPFGEGKMYHSGDLTRWLPDGNIEYMGRIDEQVKIRGFRIELGEIESRIRQIDRVKDCAVIAKADSTGEKAIYAYYTCEQEISIPEIKDKLAETVPPYMIPSYMMKLDSIPITRNGKLDKKSLPDIEAKSAKEYVAPTTETQSVICETFCEVLGLDKVGIKDGFFEMGGHSLRATRLVNIIEAKTGVKIALKDVFSHSTPEQLAALVDGTTGEEYQPIPKAESREYYPMSSTQKRTYLIQQLDPEAMTYNMPYTMKMSGEMRPEQLKSALQKMIERHEILRTAFITVDGEPVQKIMETAEVDFEYTESSEPDEKLAEEYFKPFDLSKPPLVRVKLVNKGSYHLFMMDTHHIISDGMSRNIFIKELTALYSGQTLEPLTHQYKDYSEWMRTRDMSGQAEYWKKQFEDEIPVLDMPLDFVRP